MRRSALPLLRSVRVRGLSTAASPAEADAGSEKIVAAVLFERLPLVVPEIDPTYYAFQQFSYRWGLLSGRTKKPSSRKKPLEFSEHVLEIPESLKKTDCEIEFKRIPWHGNADKSKNKRSPMRALDQRLYLLVHGSPYGTSSEKPVWHFPEKVYESEATLRECAELALKSVIGDLSHARFIGNAPLAHLSIRQTESKPDMQSFKRFFFKSQVLGLNKFHVENCNDYVWVTKDEVIEYFPEQKKFLKKMIIG